MAAHDTIKVQNQAGVSQITLNRPDVLNSFNREMALALQDALNSADQNPTIRAILLTGSGRAFCAGQDLSEVSPSESGELPPLGPIVEQCYNPIIRLIREIEKPVVCAVNGTAAGAGANLAFACDIVLANGAASFVQSFIQVGLIPDSGGTYFLPRLIGLARANALTMLGEKISSEQAQQIGLIYKVCDPTTLAAEALAVAQKLATLPTSAMGLTKRAFNQSFDNTLNEQLALELELQGQAGRSADYREGVIAFLQKRKPNFTGK